MASEINPEDLPVPLEFMEQVPFYSGSGYYIEDALDRLGSALNTLQFNQERLVEAWEKLNDYLADQDALLQGILMLAMRVRR